MVKVYDDSLRQSHVAAWRASGLTRQAYSEQHEINAHTFRGWCKRDGWREATSSPDTRSVTLIPLKVTPPVSMIEMRCGHGVVLTLPIAVSPDWLAELVRRVSAC
jgi:hypothetical protein